LPKKIRGVFDISYYHDVIDFDIDKPTWLKEALVSTISISIVLLLFLQEIITIFTSSPFTMPFLRPTALTSLTRRALHSSIRQPLAIRSISSTPARFAQGYGDGEGDPKGENPQQQGGSNATKHNAEHPGPAPPSEGQGSGAGPTKGGSGKAPEVSSANSAGSRSLEADETGSSPTGGKVGGGKSSSGPSPKIHDKSVPGEESKEKQAEVEKHNREFEQGHDRASKAGEDKVDKKFWSGEFSFLVLVMNRC
jgi:hypothetical protein